MSLKKTDKWLLVEWESGGLSVVSKGLLVNPNNNKLLIGDDVLTVKRNGKLDTARLIASERVPEMLNTILKVTAGEQQGGSSAKSDEEAKRDYSSSGSSWKPCDDDEESDDSTKVKNKIVKLEQSKRKSSNPRKIILTTTPTQSANPVIPKNMQQSKIKATMDRKSTHDSTLDQSEINKRTPNSNGSNNPQNACDVTPQAASDITPQNATKATMDRKRTHHSTVDQLKINESISDSNRSHNPQNACDVTPQNVSNITPKNATKARMDRKRTHDSSVEQFKINKYIPDANSRNNPQNACDVTPSNASKTKAMMNRKRAHVSTVDQFKINKSKPNSNKSNNPQNACYVTPQNASNITPQCTGNQNVTITMDQLIKLKDNFELLQTNIKGLKKILKITTKSKQSSNEQRIPESVKAILARNHTPNNQYVEVNGKNDNEDQNESENAYENDSDKENGYETENEEFNRSGDNVLITNRYPFAVKRH